MKKKLFFLKNLYEINFVDIDDMNYLIEYIFKNKMHQVNFIYFANFCLLDRDIDYLKAMQSSDLVLIDGIGMQMYFKALLGRSVYNNNGTILLPHILDYCEQHSHAVAFYGATAESVNGCKNKWNCVYFASDGYTELEWELIQDNSILLVGLGSPFQEKWQLKHKEMILKKGILVLGVGGFFDFCSNKAIRSPEIIINLRLEWLFRLILNPKQHLDKNIRNLQIVKYLFKARWSRLTSKK